MIPRINNPRDHYSLQQIDSPFGPIFNLLGRIEQRIEAEDLQTISEQSIFILLQFLSDIIKEMRDLSNEVLLQYEQIRDTLLQLLQDASIKLHLALDQLRSKGRTEEACRVLRQFQVALKEFDIGKSSSPPRDLEYRNVSPHNPKKTFFSTSYLTQQRLNTAQAELRYLHIELSSEATIWQDHREYALSYLRTLSIFLQDQSILLKETLATPSTTEFLTLMMKLYYADEVVQKTIALISTGSSQRGMRQKRKAEILACLQRLLTTLEEISQYMQEVRISQDRRRFENASQRAEIQRQDDALHQENLAER